jgi:hypothetical protein
MDISSAWRIFRARLKKQGSKLAHNVSDLAAGYEGTSHPVAEATPGIYTRLIQRTETIHGFMHRDCLGLLRRGSARQVQ